MFTLAFSSSSDAQINYFYGIETPELSPKHVSDLAKISPLDEISKKENIDRYSIARK